MTKATTKIFFLGATGYIGGSVLDALLRSPSASEYTISVLVRSKDQIAKLKALGVQVVEGSLEDLGLLEKESSEADIVINAAVSYRLEVAKSIAAGVAKRKAQNKPAHLIHTSGSSIISDRANGQFLGNKVYADTDDIYVLEKSDTRYPVRAVDTTLIELGEAGHFGVSIVVPPTIYGSGTGLFKRFTHQIRVLIQVAVKLRQTYYLGAGLAAWTQVHIEDLASLYVLLIDAVREGKAPSGKEGYMFAETGEYTFKALSEAIAPVLYAKGLVDTPEALPFPSVEQAASLTTDGHIEFFGIAFGSNSRVRAVRAREVLGWKPVHNSADLFDSMEEQVEFAIAQAGPLNERGWW